MAVEIKAPHPVPKGKTKKVFLAGSIEMGKAANWQQAFKEEMVDLDLVILNPRRENWDVSWPQTASHEGFREQVEWELEGLSNADIIVFYFDPDTMSPVTMMELGYVARMYDTPVLVCCPEGFWRKGNVDILCMREKMVRVGSFEELLKSFRESFLILHAPPKPRVVPFGIVCNEEK